MGNLKWASLLTKEYLEEMCKVTGVPASTLNGYLKRYGLTPSLIDRNQRSFSDILTKEFLLSVFPKHSITDIAKMVNGSRGVVDKYLAKHGLYRLKKVRRGGKKKSVAEILTVEYLRSVHKDKTVKEIAQETGCGASTVRKNLHGFGLSLKNSRLGKHRGVNSPTWKGGYKNKSGYRFKYCPRTRKSRREHLVIMKEYLGRELNTNEVIHHCNGHRSDNRLDNLLLMERKKHDTFHSICKTFKLDFTNFNKEDVISFLNQGRVFVDFIKRCIRTNTVLT